MLDAAADVWSWAADFWFGRPESRTRESEEAIDRVDARAWELITELRDKRQSLAADAREAFRLLGRVSTVLHWDRLRPELSDLILGAVHEAEQFGDGEGPRKRRFAIELITRVVERYNYAGTPFPPSIERAIVAPVVGMIIDWSVQILNSHHIWPPSGYVKFPSLFQGFYGSLFQFALRAAMGVVKLRKFVFGLTKYERLIRGSLRTLDPQIQRILAELPPSRLQAVLEEVANVIAELGRVTAPYVRLVNNVLMFGDEFIELDPSERKEAAYRVLYRLLSEAYSDDAFALTFLDSPFGDYLLRAIVDQTARVLERNGLILDAP